MGRKPTTCQYFQPLTLQTVTLAAAAINCALSEYACGKKATVMFSQDEYQDEFGPSPEINSTPAVTALLDHTFVGSLIPTALQLRENTRSSIPVTASQS
jgi:hypothetical protein